MQHQTYGPRTAAWLALTEQAYYSRYLGFDDVGAFQAIAHYLADASTAVEGGTVLVHEAAWAWSEGKSLERLAPMAKLFASEIAERVCSDAIQIHGANGYSNEFPVERYLRNSKAAVIYEGTSQLHTLIQADYALGYREDRPLRCEPWPAQGFERG